MQDCNVLNVLPVKGEFSSKFNAFAAIFSWGNAGQKVRLDLHVTIDCDIIIIVLLIGRVNVVKGNFSSNAFAAAFEEMWNNR